LGWLLFRSKMAGSCVGCGVTIFSKTTVAGLTIDAGAPEASTKNRSRLATRSPPKSPVDMCFCIMFETTALRGV